MSMDLNKMQLDYMRNKFREHLYWTETTAHRERVLRIKTRRDRLKKELKEVEGQLTGAEHLYLKIHLAQGPTRESACQIMETQEVLAAELKRKPGLTSEERKAEAQAGRDALIAQQRAKFKHNRVVYMTPDGFHATHDLEDSELQNMISQLAEAKFERRSIVQREHAITVDWFKRNENGGWWESYVITQVEDAKENKQQDEA